MYEWQKGEPITADKLNLTGVQLRMENIFSSPVGGGLDTSLDPDTWDDPGSYADPRRVEMGAHSLGSVTLEYNDTTDEWTPRGGTPGVTGYKETSGGALKWLTDAKKDGDVWQVWQQTFTDNLGNPTSSQLLVRKSVTNTSTLWGGVSGAGGVIYRHLAYVQWEASMKRWKVTNQNKTFILPVARHYGWHYEAYKDLSSDSDWYNRRDNQHILPMAGEPIGNTIPIYPIAEGGGVNVSMFSYGSDLCGVGISAGIEFYDEETVLSMNTDDPRPQGKTAEISIFGRTLTIQPCGDHDDRPWQFLLTMGNEDFDPGSDGWGDPGSDSKIFCTYYPPGHPDAVNNRPGLIRGIKAFDGILPAPFIQDGIIWVSGQMA